MNTEQLAEIVRCRSNWDEVENGLVLELDPDPLFNLYILRQDGGLIIGVSRTFCLQSDSHDVAIEQTFYSVEGEEEAFQIAAELFLIVARTPYLRKPKGGSKYLAHWVGIGNGLE